MKTALLKFARASAVCIAAAVSSLSLSNEAASDTLFANEYLYHGQRLSSPGCFYHLDMQADGNLVLYSGIQQTSPVWASNTVGAGAYAVMQADGNFVVYDWGNAPVWASGTQGFWWSRLDMQNDGNLVIYSGTEIPPFFPLNTAIWASGTNGESVGVSHCHVPTLVTVVENDRNRAGGDYKVIDIDRNWPQACEYWCAQDTSCKAFTYVPAPIQGPQARCWLKNHVPEASYGPGMVSGFIKGR
jgi:hypothetical protein